MSAGAYAETWTLPLLREGGISCTTQGKQSSAHIVAALSEECYMKHARPSQGECLQRKSMHGCMLP